MIGASVVTVGGVTAEVGAVVGPATTVVDVVAGVTRRLK